MQTFSDTDKMFTRKSKSLLMEIIKIPFTSYNSFTPKLACSNLQK